MPAYEAGIFLLGINFQGMWDWFSDFEPSAEEADGFKFAISFYGLLEISGDFKTERQLNYRRKKEFQKNFSKSVDSSLHML